MNRAADIPDANRIDGTIGGSSTVIARTTVPTPDGEAEIVTRRRGDGELQSCPDLALQTDVLTGPLAGAYQRYETLEEALVGHEVWVGTHRRHGKRQ